MLVRFVQVLMLRVYGKHLLQPSAAVWLTFMALLALSMAAVEGIVWGVTAQGMLPKEYAMFGGLVGALVAVLIWFFDASLITLDISEQGDGAVKKTRRWSEKLLWGLLIRSLIVVSTLVVTAPLLGQLFLQIEISNRIHDLNDEKIATLMQSQIDAYDRLLQRQRDQYDHLQVKIQDEIAGISGSKKYGYGPVADAIQLQIDHVNQEIESLFLKKSMEIARIQSATAAELRSLYGVPLLMVDSFETRNQIHHAMKQEDEGYPMSELLAMLLLALMFIVLMVLKLFQSRGVVIYFNARLQEYYQNYLSGEYSAYIAENERASGPSPMHAYRFHDWIEEMERIHPDALRAKLATKPVVVGKNSWKEDAVVDALIKKHPAKSEPKSE
ncbi:MAG: DUF4407 domain-containing protein, partial [Zetaproteobacteria bacterium]|nr:DUF4407 domain-containing protein [Zetaproteobacteria bacterium]